MYPHFIIILAMTTNIDTIIHEPREKVKAFLHLPPTETLIYEEDGVQHTYTSSLPPIYVGYRKVEELLIPQHPFFAGLDGFLNGYSERYCQDDQVRFQYPKLDYIRTPPLNPYRMSCRAAKSALHSRRALLAVLQAYHQAHGTTKLLYPTFTFPKEISCALSEHPYGVKLAWGAWKKFYRDFNTFFVGADGLLRSWTFGGRANLHLWSSTVPLLPHWHFHCLAVNCIVRRCDDGSFMFNSVQFNLPPERLVQLKRLWSKQVIALAKKIDVGIALNVNELNEEEETLAVVNWQWCPITARGKTIHEFKYTNRCYLEDFAVFSNKDINCAFPPEIFVYYNNRARVFGWFRWIKDLLKAKQIVLSKKIEKPCMFCDKELVDINPGRLSRAPPMNNAVYRDWCNETKKYVYKPVDPQKIRRWLGLI